MDTCVKKVSDSARKCWPVVEFASGSDGSNAIETSSYGTGWPFANSAPVMFSLGVPGTLATIR